MTLLARIEHAGRPRVGILEGEGIRLHEGTIFDPGPATARGSGGCRRALANADRAHQDGGAVEQFPRRCREERLGDPGRAADLPEGAEQLRRPWPDDPGAEIL
jgi:hypothetical protein